MGYRLEPFAHVGLTAALLESEVSRHERESLPRLDLLWSYYRNPMSVGAARRRRSPGESGPASGGALRYGLAQMSGLPARLTRHASSASCGVGESPAEVVIENDIAWRIHTMVDFMFGRPVSIVSTARDGALRARVERVLDAVWEASGGIVLLQDMALLGHVYGHVDLVVRAAPPSPSAGSSRAAPDEAEDAASRIRVEVIEPTRGVALQSASDYRVLDAYVLRYRRDTADVEPAHARDGILARILGRERASSSRRAVTVTEVLSASWRQVYEDSGDGPRLIEEGPNVVSPGRVPVAHVQNMSQPFAYPGLGEVEPLIPLQDELNTRLSDRASRVTMQSFKMYLAKGIEGFDKSPVGPGQVWSTDNPDARVESFGGDASSPSEDAHVEQVREALDKISGVPPLAAGVVRAKIGNLSSENALRVTLLGLTSKTARKRVTYGRGIADACSLILGALHEAGVMETDERDRGVRIEWADPVPRDERAVLDAAMKKIELGVPRERVLVELGYSPTDAGVI